MSLISPADDQRDYAPKGAATLAHSDAARSMRREAVESIRAALDQIDARQSLPRLAQLLRESSILADLMVATARDGGATWETIAEQMREPVGDVYRRFGRVHSGRPDSPVDEDGTAAMYLSLLPGAGEDRDDLIRSARAAGASYREIGAATGLSRAMLDRIVNERTY